MSQSRNSTLYYRSEKYNIIDPYRLDGNLILSEMIKKQESNRLYNPQAQYTKYRSELLGFVKYIQGRLEYSQRTYYLGVSILDNLLSQYNIEKGQLKLVCFMALHMAAKMEESYEKIPELGLIAKLFEDKFEIQDIKDWEVSLSKSVGHNFNIRTPYTFIEFFLSKGIVNDQDVNSQDINEIEEEINKFEGLVMSFLQICTNNYEFYKFDPLTIAASAIVCAKKVAGYEKYWSRDLEQLTTMKLQDLETCAKMMYKIHKGTENTSMEIEETKSVNSNSRTSLKTDYSGRCVDSTVKMAVEVAHHEQVSGATDFMGSDTDEEEPAKNRTTYKSRGTA